jgi:hypothetical protein
MKVKIGFPVVGSDASTVFAVWIGTSPANGTSGTAYWNGVPLPLQNSQFNNELTEIARGILQTRNLYFSCDNSSYAPTRDVITGVSFGLAMTLALHYELPFLQSEAALEVLLSGGVDRDSGYSPIPLAAPDETGRKAKFAANKGISLLLLREDYICLPQDICLYDVRVPESRLPPTPEALFTDKQKLGNQGRSYWLPCNIMNGAWNDDPSYGIPWFQVLGAYFGFKEVVSLSGAPNSVPVPEAEQSSTSDLVVESVQGTIGQLYSTAISYSFHSSYKDAFLRHNSRLCNQELFPDGVAEQALAVKEKIFYTDDSTSLNQHILVSGPTACGKTFLAEALLLNSVLNDKTAIYIAPTRALAKERYSELISRFAFEGNGVFSTNSRNHSDDIVLSTGEASGDDWRLVRNRFRIAVLVNEKANLFLRPSTDFLEKLGLVVIDELQFIGELNRGGVLDLFLAKICEENMRRQKLNYPSTIRIVGLTTERSSIDRVFFPAFHFRILAGDESLPPLLLGTEQRPVPVTHLALVYKQRINTPITIRERAQSESELRMPASECNALSYTIRTQIRELERAEGGAQYHQRLTQARIIEMFAAKGYRSIMAASTSIVGLWDLGNQIKSLRKTKGHPEADDSGLRDLIQNGEIGSTHGKMLLELAKNGIYLHSSELSRKIREHVEDHFRRPPSETKSRTEVLLTTETLFYGVNLSADCVILLSPLWPRDSDDGAEPDIRFQTANGYYNIMGRAGRPGFPCERALAVLCFPSVDSFANLSHLGDAMLSYYGPVVRMPGQETPSSTLILRSDIQNLRDGTISSIEDVSYESFRSVLDALRHENGVNADPAEVAKVVALIRYTVFFQSTKFKSDELQRLIEKILEVAEKVRLVESSPRGYKVTAQAEALIDTGTKWQSVAPMKVWVDSLSRLKYEASQSEPRGARIWPVELLAPAFIASHDFWKSARVFCSEIYNENPQPAMVQANETTLRDRLMNELRRLLIDINDCKAIELELSAMCARTNQALTTSMPLSPQVDPHRKAIMYRLFIALLMWLRGADSDEINRLSLPDDGGAITRTFKPQYSDRASWLANMCHRYFDKVGQLLPEHVRDLPAFSERLRLGVLPNGLPFMAQRRSDLNRTDVRKLLESGATPAAILREKDPISLLQSKGVFTESRPKFYKGIVEEVYEYYCSQIETLAAAVAVRSTEKIWARFAMLMVDIIKQQAYPEIHRGSTGDEAKVVCETLWSMLNLKKQGSLDSERDKQEITPIMQSGDRSLLVQCGEAGKEIFLRVATPDMDLNDVSPGEIVIHLPWPRVSRFDGNAVHLTACGAMVLCELAGRKFIEAPHVLFTWVRENTGLRSIKDIVMSFRMPSLLPVHREALLRLSEPGIEDHQ